MSARENSHAEEKRVAPVKKVATKVRKCPPKEKNGSRLSMALTGLRRKVTSLREVQAQAEMQA